MQVDIGYAAGCFIVDIALIADNKAEEILLEMFRRDHKPIVVKSYVPARLVIGKGKVNPKTKFQKKVKLGEVEVKKSYRDLGNK